MNFKKHIHLSDMIWSFASGSTNSLMAKNITSIIIKLSRIELSPVDIFQSLRCLNDSLIHMIPWAKMCKLWFGWVTYSSHHKFSNIYLYIAIQIVIELKLRTLFDYLHNYYWDKLKNYGSHPVFFQRSYLNNFKR